jgi:hypothetical protein
MMKRELIINITSVILLLLGMLTLSLPVLSAAARAESYSMIAQAVLLLAAGWFLYKRSALAAAILAISAVYYFLGGWYAAYSRNLSISVLIPAFYWSLALRVLVVLFVFYLLKRPSESPEC